ncbi:MAG: GTPase Era [Granulosicoccaceae bacterium]|jgi:GTP-binding protein Era
MSGADQTRCGYVALVGRPNVGKSTLLNHMLGQKISITSRKPQTTRHRVLGIKTTDTTQMLFVDTPGIHDDQRQAMSRFMNRAAVSAITDVDVVVFVVEATGWQEADQKVLEKVRYSTRPVVLVINKIDRLKGKDALLPLIAELQAKTGIETIVPVSATKGSGLDRLEEVLAGYLPEAPFFFDKDQVTDRSMRFIAAELIREKLMRRLGKEVPYATTVEIEKYAREGDMWHIAAVILVERKGQKSIVVGKGGEMIKAIGQQAREELEKMLESKVYLQLWVKVRAGWSDDERALRSLGYTDEL